MTGDGSLINNDALSIQITDLLSGLNLQNLNLQNQTQKQKEDTEVESQNETSQQGAAAGLVSAYPNEIERGLISKGQRWLDDKTSGSSSGIDKSRLKSSRCGIKDGGTASATTSNSEVADNGGEHPQLANREGGFGGITMTNTSRESSSGKGFEYIDSSPSILNTIFLSPQVMELLETTPQDSFINK